MKTKNLNNVKLWEMMGNISRKVYSKQKLRDT